MRLRLLFGLEVHGFSSRGSKVATYTSTDSDQLDLFEEEIRRLPWRGRSPRELTRGFKALFLGHTPREHERFFASPDQYELELATKKGPRRPAGASLLIEPRRPR